MSTSRRLLAACVGMVCVAVGASAAFPATLDSETFDGAYKITGTGQAVAATGGVFHITGTGAEGNATYEYTGLGAGVPFTISALVGEGTGANGGFNVGFLVGENNVIFHPGYAGAALRVEGPNGLGNQNVGFTPAANVLHPLTVTGDGAGNFTVTLQDGSNPANTYTNTWSNPGNPLTAIGVRRSGPQTIDGLFDNVAFTGQPLQPFSHDFATTAFEGGRVEVGSGRLTMQRTGSNSFTFDGQAGNLLISGDVGTSAGSNGNTNVGLRIGGNTIVFHPGLANGALRVEGPGGFWNTDMNFTPASNVLHHVDVALNAATGQFTVFVSDGSNPNTVYRTQFTNTAYAPVTDRIGFQYASGASADEGRYDNFRVSRLNPTEGPPSWISAVQASNPLHWYRLDEVGSRIAVDSGSAGSFGLLQGTIAQGAAGAVDGASGFNGSDSRINLGLADLSGPWTAEFIVKRDSARASSSLIGRTGFGTLKLEQWNNTGQVGFTRYGVDDYLFSGGYSAPLGEFVYLTFQGDPANGVSLFVNGQPAGTNPNYMALPLNEIGGPELGNMTLDEVLVYDRLLNQSEIVAHSVQAGFDVPEPVTAFLLLIGLPAVAARVRRRVSR